MKLPSEMTDEELRAEREYWHAKWRKQCISYSHLILANQYDAELMRRKENNRGE